MTEDVLKDYMAIIQTTPVYMNIIRLLQFFIDIVLIALKTNLKNRKLIDKSKAKVKNDKTQKQHYQQNDKDESSTIKILTKLNYNLQFSRKILRVALTIKSIMICVNFCKEMYLGPITIEMLLRDSIVFTDTIFALFDIGTLTYMKPDKQNQFDRKSLIFGSIPSSFICAFAWGRLLFQSYSLQNNLFIINRLFNCVQNSLDFLLFLLQYFKKSQEKTITYLGFTTSIMRIIRQLQM